MKKDSDSCIICNGNTSLATGTFINIYIYIFIFIYVCVCVINQETCGNKIKCLQS